MQRQYVLSLILQLFIFAFFLGCKSETNKIKNLPGAKRSNIQRTVFVYPDHDEVKIIHIQKEAAIGNLKNEQLVNIDAILEASEEENFDKYILLTIAFKESSFYADRKSNTGDFGLFQINIKWWSKYLGYASYEEFVKKNINPKINTKNAIVILRDFKRYKTCQATDIFACYNGGPMWRKSNNRKFIEEYKKSSLKTMSKIKKKYNEWIFE